MDAFEFTVAHDTGIRVVDHQTAEQGNECGTLGWSAGVGITAFLIQSAFITDADGVGIVMSGMHADLFFVASLVELTITLNVIMVADTFAVETGVVTGAKHFNRKTLVGARGAAVNDNKIDFTTHIFKVLERLMEVAVVSLRRLR